MGSITKYIYIITLEYDYLSIKYIKNLIKLYYIIKNRIDNNIYGPENSTQEVNWRGITSGNIKKTINNFIENDWPNIYQHKYSDRMNRNTHNKASKMNKNSLKKYANISELINEEKKFANTLKSNNTSKLTNKEKKVSNIPREHINLNQELTLYNNNNSELRNLLKGGKKKTLTKWQKFLKKHKGKGKSMDQLSRMYKKENSKKKKKKTKKKTKSKKKKKVVKRKK